MRAEKQFLVDEVAGYLTKSKYLLIANFTGVTVKDAALHFELGEVLEEGDQDLGDAGRVVAAGDEGGVAAQVSRDVGELRLLRGDVEDAVLDDVVLGAVGTELVTDGSRVLDGDAGEVGKQQVVGAGQLGGDFVDEELFFSAHVREFS